MSETEARPKLSYYIRRGLGTREDDRLADAAPSLLRACKDMEVWFSAMIAGGRLRPNVELDRIRAAIALAEGGE